MLAERIPSIQRRLTAERIDGWLFCCFQQNDPVSLELLGLAGDHLVTRRCYYLVPRSGQPVKLVHRLEPSMLDQLPGEKRSYMRWSELHAELERLVAGCERVAAQYSPQNALPTISRLDAGTAELLRGFGVEIVSSAELVQEFAAVWTPAQLASHRRASEHLHRIVLAAFDRVRSTLTEGARDDEHAVQQYILEQFEAADLWTESPPIVAINENSADPHYQPAADRTSSIGEGDFLLIDLWAKERPAESVYADITWCAVCSAAPTDRQAQLFDIAVRARDAGWDLIASRYPEREICGYEVDDATRSVIDQAGFGDSFIHRTGHSIGIQDHGQGANLDNLETHDERRLAPMTGFSIEPGIYLPGDFGVRTEINVALTPERAEITGAEPQRELLRLLA